MYLKQIYCFFVLFVIIIVIINATPSRQDIPGAIEIHGYSNRKARKNWYLNKNKDFDINIKPPQIEKQKADIEQVRQNIDEYNKLMKIDMKNLSNHQKDMLEKIVERVARLKETLDLDIETTTIDYITNTDIDLLTTTLETDLNEARANNLNRVINKTKLRQNHNKRPLTNVIKGTTRRPIQNKITTRPTYTSLINPTVAVSQKILNTITTIQPSQLKHNQNNKHDNLRKQQIRHNQQRDDINEKTISIINENHQNHLPTTTIGLDGISDTIYDINSTTSSIVDTLSDQAREEYYTRDPSSPIPDGNKEMKTPSTAKPTKYHYYPHNQHIYLLPECAIQQVCNAVYVRLNYTQPLCACPSRYRDPCSASLNEDDQHTTKLIGDEKRKAITLAKTCEATTEMRECRSPKDWSLLALQNTRTGKSHYLVICRCPDHFKLEGPMAHDQPTYASVPGIRVFGMMCVKAGYSVRRPSIQPPKRFQLQKPYYTTTQNKYNTNKDTRPTYLQETYQNQHQANYQYLNRPDSTPIVGVTHSDYNNPNSINKFSGIYGRNNEKKGETITADDLGVTESSSKREKRNINDIDNNNNYNYNDGDDNDLPEFPWHRLEELKKSIIWD